MREALSYIWQCYVSCTADSIEKFGISPYEDFEFWLEKRIKIGLFLEK